MAKFILVLIFLFFASFVDCRSLVKRLDDIITKELEMKMNKIEELYESGVLLRRELKRLRRSEAADEGGRYQHPGELIYKSNEDEDDSAEISKKIEESLDSEVLCNVGKAQPDTKVRCPDGKYDVIWSPVDDGRAANIKFYSSIHDPEVSRL